MLTHAAEKEKNTIVYPTWIEAAPADADMSVPNWYLKNFTNIDQSNVDTYRSARGASDQEYKSRLEKLSKRYGINLPYNDIVKNYIERYVVKNRSQVSSMLGLWPYYKPIFEKELSNHNIPEGLKYLPVACSALNPNVISNEGAAGLWLFMIAPAKGNGLEVNTIVDERFDPYRSSEKAAEYLKKLYSSYKDWLLAIAAHTCGIGNVNKSIQRAKRDKINNPNFWDIYKFLPKDRRVYVPAFIAACYAMNYFKEHEITPTLTNRRLVTATTTVSKRVSIHQISQVLGIDQNEIRFLNPQYREEVNDVIVIPGNIRPYTLTLPSGQINSYRIAEDRIANYQKKQFERRAEVQPGDIKSIVGGEEDFDNGIYYHEVIEDEDLASIANRYGVNVEDLRKTNRLASNDIKPGDIIQINTKKGSSRKTNTNTANDKPSSGSSSYSGSNSGRANNNDDVAQNTPKHVGADSRNVPNRPNKESQISENYMDDDFSNSQQSYEEEMKRQREIERKKREAARKKAAEDAKKKAAEEAKKKAAEDAKRKAAEEAKRKAAEDAKKKAAEDAKKKAAEEAARKKAADEAARKKAAEEAAKPIVHQVKEGNNLTKLAEQYGVTIADIKAANPDLKDENIKIGQKINIPKKGQHATQSNKPTDKQVNTTQNSKQQPSSSATKDKKTKVTEDAAKNKAAEEAAKKKKAADDAKKKAAEYAKKKATEEAAKKKAAEEAAKKKATEEAAKKKAAEEAAKKKAAEEAAKKKAAEEAAKKKAAEEAKKPIHHEVKEGNNLTKLAAQYGVTPDEIRKANNIKGDNIRIGQKLIIPKNGTKQSQGAATSQPKQSTTNNQKTGGAKKK